MCSFTDVAVGPKGVPTEANILCARPLPPSPPVLCAIATSHPARSASSPSSLQRHLLHAAELHIADELHFAAEIRARTLCPETRVLLSSAHCCCVPPPILCVVADPKGN
jgi:hypothetical protein